MSAVEGRRTKDEEKQSYVDGYEADAVAAERRLQELEELGRGDSPEAEGARDRIANATRLLKEYGVTRKDVAKRPAGRAKETR